MAEGSNMTGEEKSSSREYCRCESLGSNPSFPKFATNLGRIGRYW